MCSAGVTGAGCDLSYHEMVVRIMGPQLSAAPRGTSSDDAASRAITRFVLYVESLHSSLSTQVLKVHEKIGIDALDNAVLHVLKED